MNTYKITTLIFGAILMLSLSGCKKVNGVDDRVGKTELSFAVTSISGPAISLTKVPQPFPADMAFRVVVLKAGGADFTTPVSDVTYITTTGGAAIPKTDNDRLLLNSGNYDLYFIMPSSVGPNPEGVVSVDNGVDFMTVKKANVQIGGPGGSSQVVDVEFSHLCSAIDVTVKANQYISSMEIVAGSKIGGLPGNATYNLISGTMNYGAAGDYALEANSFVSVGSGPLTVISTSNSGFAVNTGSNVKPTLELSMLINGEAKTVTYSFPDAFVAGNKYNVTLTLAPNGTATGIDITVTPWGVGSAIDGGTVPSSIKIGEFVDDGVVFWIDPLDDTHYKVMDVREHKNVTWAQASDLCNSNGAGWRMPTVAELLEVYKLRKDDLENSIFDKAIGAHYGNSVGSVLWTSQVSGDNASVCDVSLGTQDHSTPKTQTYGVRAVKDVGLIDFSYVDKPSNCYITYPGKIMAFKATLKPRVKGGSISSKTTCTDVRAAEEKLNADIPLSSIKRVAVTWQTAANHGTTGGAANMIIQKIAYNEATGVCKVTPHATGTGNAVISAYDAGGTILWNWHVWVTDGTVGDAGATSSGKLFMDRNLGALAAIATKPTKADAYKYFGVMYQHGRPTPFSGQGLGEVENTYTKIYDKEGAEITSSIGGYTHSNTAVATLASAIQTPNTYYCYEDRVITGGNLTWYQFGDISLWSDAPAAKSLYDPCPYGYRVPINGSWSAWTTPHTQKWTAYAIDGGVALSNTWWPAAGYRNYGTGVYEGVGLAGNYWSSARNASYKYYSFNMTTHYAGNVAPSNRQERSASLAVRCVQE